MCGIGFIASRASRGGAIEPDSASSSSEAARKLRPDIEDLLGDLKRRGPDCVAGADLRLSPLGQEIEHWVLSEDGDAGSKGGRNYKHSKCEQAGRDSSKVDEGMRKCYSSMSDYSSDQLKRRDSLSTTNFQFVGATLQLRGIKPVAQPMEDDHGNVLLFNGEVFGGLDVDENENDTKILMAVLEGCCGCTCRGDELSTSSKCSGRKNHHTIPHVLSRLRGPWALIYWQAVSQTLWFGRDAIGRRSLLIHRPSREDPRLLLTSVAPDASEGIFARLKYWEELQCGIYSLNFPADRAFESGHCWPRTSGLLPEDGIAEHMELGISRDGSISSAVAHSWQDPFFATLLEWRRKNVSPVDNSLVSVSGQSGRQASSYVKSDFTVVPPQRQEERSSLSFDCTPDGTSEPTKNHHDLEEEPKAERNESPVGQLLAALRRAVKKRTIHIKRHQCCSHLVTSDIERSSTRKRSETTAPVAVLFSGGLDSMILAGLAHEFVDPECCIDLLNVSFDGQLAPDRITAIDGVAELRKTFRSRRWRLVEVDSELTEMDRYRVHMQTLICPSNTYMDLNIGTALWLAASGEGRVRDISPGEGAAADTSWRTSADLISNHLTEASLDAHPAASSESPEEVFVRSEARVLLVGSGADEQCGGYGRHRTKFRLGGWVALDEEMRLDFQRIWKRNLGRDDRCIADWGKEARFPFLDEDVVALLLSFPLWDVVDLREPPGVGDKKILRQVAQHMGLMRAATAQKRAIQFGSRIARESNRTKFGSNRAANQASAGSAMLAVDCQQSIFEKGIESSRE